VPQADVVIKLNAPHPAQKTILDSPARFRVAFCGRRWGKTDADVEAILLGNSRRPGAIIEPGIYWWVGLSWTAASMKRAWRMLKRHCHGWCEINETKGEIRLPNGSEIWLRTAEHPEALSGEGVRGLIIDEFTMMQERVWWEHLRPSLSDTLGWALFTGVPKGKNWAWQIWTYEQQGEPGWQSWQMPTSTNPFILPSEIEDARRKYPDILFRQEYGAEVLDDAGSVFRNVVECSDSTQLEMPEPKRDYIMGVDLAKMYDFTVVSVWDADAHREVYLDRFSGINYSLQKPRIIEAAKRFGCSAVIVETNSMGEPIVEDLEAAGLPIIRFTTTQSTKGAAIESLALALEQKAAHLLTDSENVAVLEMQAFGMIRLATGIFRYGAPSGLHDDIVMARAFAWSQIAGVGYSGAGWVALADKLIAEKQAAANG
jgi:hypothetical protein